ncbi:hypothetical protein H9Q72_009759 [Fusarium xylarioides]|uniref:Uncharacterized protein n=1 Tax=Fusarium xylarioides TaxID=221167 RepID=A0A9P7HK52_9HYPO|nr:hypothetical protein H9Q72_009759 [Fusarium xylarioides]
MLFRKNYSGPEKVDFDCIIEKGNLESGADITFPAGNVNGKTTVKDFCDQLVRDYTLPGRTSLHLPNGDELSDVKAYIGEVIAERKSVRLRNGRRAIAEGGRAGGATFKSGGETLPPEAKGGDAPHYIK